MTTVKFIIATCFLFLSQVSYAADSVSVLFGGHSKHFTDYAKEYRYNETHNMIGVMWDDKWVLSTFENSYYNRSVLLAYNHTYYEDRILGLDLGASVSVGLVSGYKNKLQMGDLYLGNEISIHIMPSFHIGYHLTKDISLVLNQSFLPASGGWIYFNSFALKYKF